jgi:hypothetical protein
MLSDYIKWAEQFSLMIKLLYKWLSVDYPSSGDGRAPVGSPVFKIGDGLSIRPWWVRLPSIPAFLLEAALEIL